MTSDPDSPVVPPIENAARRPRDRETRDGQVARPDRRSVLALAAAGALGAGWATAPVVESARADTARPPSSRLDRAVRELERRSGRTIGVAAADGRRVRFGYRMTESFPMCSLFKPLAVGALLREHAYDESFWAREITFTADQIVINSPVCAADPDRRMSVTALADAALRFSDNTAGNLLLQLLGGPAAVTAFARQLGARRTRLDRWEPELNESRPGDPRDTSTPADIEQLYRRMLLEDELGRLGQARLREWMLRNATSGERLRQVLPAGAELADKTGAGDYGVVNDAGVYWRGSEVLSLAVLTRADQAGAANHNWVVARVGELMVRAFLR